jgi:hypothetical protein
VWRQILRRVHSLRQAGEVRGRRQIHFDTNVFAEFDPRLSAVPA